MSSPRDLPATLTDRLAFLLQLATGRAQRMGERALADLGITGREYGVLALLEGDGARVQHMIGAGLGMDRTTTMTLIAALERRRLVDRVRDPADARAYLIRLTPAGERTRATAAIELEHCDQLFTAALKPADQVTLRKLLVVLTDASDDPPRGD